MLLSTIKKYSGHLPAVISGLHKYSINFVLIASVLCVSAAHADESIQASSETIINSEQTLFIASYTSNQRAEHVQRSTDLEKLRELSQCEMKIRNHPNRRKKTLSLSALMKMANASRNTVFNESYCRSIASI